MLNIVIPMAGAGSRFAQAGFEKPKPLIEVLGVPMIKIVIDNLRPSQQHRFIFICQEAHVDQYGLKQILESWAPGCEILTVNGVTAGAAISVLAAKKFIDNDDPLMIANSDQYIDCSIDEYLEKIKVADADGLIMTMSATDPKWSFIRYDDQGRVLEVQEKIPISDEATVGIYNFQRGSDFVRAAEKMVKDEITSAGEYYVAPTYNFLIQDRKNIVFFNVGSEANGMYGLGIPSDLELFTSLDVGNKAAEKSR